MSDSSLPIITRRQAVTSSAALAAAGAAGLAMAPSASAAYRVNRRTLRKGDRNDDVLYFQRKVRSAGFWPGTPDGVYGAQTEQVVWAVQKAYGLKPDGVVGQKTWLAAIRQPNIPVKTTKGKYIEVDLDRQLLFYVVDGKIQQVHNTSTGNGKGYWYNKKWYPHAKTPRGTWRSMWNEDKGWRVGQLGRMWRPFFFAPGGYAVHGSTFIPPYPDSHGCCRLSVKAMDHMIATGAIRWDRDITVYGTGPNQDPLSGQFGAGTSAAPQHVVELGLTDVRSTI
ncbi:peptidoglycan-binding protein [Kytococcus sedentarius]|uniref:L,D-transpeptidase family protein n=1 Tax=Kytococcus sedentarius TaxID=1276 RepID=UPI0035BC637B